MQFKVLSLVLFLFFITFQRTTSQIINEEQYNALEYRLIGPFRGGRSAAVTGVPNQPNCFFFGSTGGGFCKTLDGGRTWDNISVGFFGVSIGAFSVAKNDPNVIYVG
jgi:hypothetical protein